MAPMLRVGGIEKGSDNSQPNSKYSRSGSRNAFTSLMRLFLERNIDNTPSFWGGALATLSLSTFTIECLLTRALQFETWCRRYFWFVLCKKRSLLRQTPQITSFWGILFYRCKMSIKLILSSLSSMFLICQAPRQMSSLRNTDRGKWENQDFGWMAKLEFFNLDNLSPEAVSEFLKAK